MTMPARPSVEGCGPVGLGPELASLFRVAGVLTPAEVHPEDLVDVADTLRRVAVCGPYFTVSTGPVAEPGWRPVRALYEDSAVLAGLVERVRARIGAAQPRVAASIMFQGYAARLWSVSLGALVRDGRLPDLHPDGLLWRDQDGSVRLHLQRTEGWRGAHLENVLAGTVLVGHLTPLIRAVHRLGPLSDRLLWGNAVSALLGLPAHSTAPRLVPPGWWPTGC